MIVVTTSWAPRHALSAPGMNPQAAPPSAPANRAATIAIGKGNPGIVPTRAAQNAPTSSWPLAPMLNSPARNANATDKPAKISGVAELSVLAIAFGLLSDPSSSAP